MMCIAMPYNSGHLPVPPPIVAATGPLVLCDDHTRVHLFALNTSSIHRMPGACFQSGFSPLPPGLDRRHIFAKPPLAVPLNVFASFSIRALFRHIFVITTVVLHPPNPTTVHWHEPRSRLPSHANLGDGGGDNASEPGLR